MEPDSVNDYVVQTHRLETCRNKLTRVRSDQISRRDAVSMLKDLTNEVLGFVRERVPSQKVVDLYHDNIRLLLKKWPLQPIETKMYLDQLLKAKGNVATLSFSFEVYEILKIVNEVQEEIFAEGVRSHQLPKVARKTRALG